jgi:hypothetical protein
VTYPKGQKVVLFGGPRTGTVIGEFDEAGCDKVNVVSLDRPYKIINRSRKHSSDSPRVVIIDTLLVNSDYMVPF